MFQGMEVMDAGCLCKITAEPLNSSQHRGRLHVNSFTQSWKSNLPLGASQELSLSDAEHDFVRLNTMRLHSDKSNDIMQLFTSIRTFVETKSIISFLKSLNTVYVLLFSQL